MPQYALIGRHPPNSCPMSSKGAREAAMRAYDSLEKVSKAKNVKLLQDLHLDPAHRAFMLFEGPSAEAVRDVLVDTGFVQFLDFDFHLVTPIRELLKQSDKHPTVFP